MNPKHLFLGTASENTRDAVSKNRNFNSSKTHCKYGHAFDEKNTRFYRWYSVTGREVFKRKCETCDKTARHRRYLAKKARLALPAKGNEQ